MRIKFIKSPCGIGYGYSEGEEAEFPATLAKEFIRDKFARELKPKTDIPPDFPSRHIFVKHGFASLEEIREIATIELLTAFQGIGEPTAKRIVKYFKQ